MDILTYRHRARSFTFDGQQEDPTFELVVECHHDLRCATLHVHRLRLEIDPRESCQLIWTDQVQNYSLDFCAFVFGESGESHVVVVLLKSCGRVSGADAHLGHVERIQVW
jgi:hypothetical protein